MSIVVFVFLFSVVMWAIVAAVILSTPRDLLRTVQMHRDTGAMIIPPFSSFPRSSVSGANARPLEAGDLTDCQGFVIDSTAFSTHGRNAWVREELPGPFEAPGSAMRHVRCPRTRDGALRSDLILPSTRTASAPYASCHS